MSSEKKEDCIAYIKEHNPGGFVNTKILVQDIALLKKATLFFCSKSIARATFPVERKMFQSFWDYFTFVKNIPRLMRTFRSYFKSASLIEKFPLLEPKSINPNQFEKLMSLFKDCGIDNVGYVKISECDVFKHLGVPYKHVIVFTAHQSSKIILSSPSIKSQFEVMRVYGLTGRKANQITKHLNENGFGCMPGHSMGGSVSYPKLAYMAGLGCLGRHGMLIEPTGGPNCRIGVVFTNIDNLSEFFNDSNEHLWIKDFCAKCGKCIKKCPQNAIKEKASIDQNAHITSIHYKKCHLNFGPKNACNICVKECPFTTIGYEKIKASFNKKEV